MAISNSASRPSVPINLQNAVLSHLVLSLEGVAAHHESKKRGRGGQQTGPNKRRKRTAENEDAISPPVGTSTVPGEMMDVDNAEGADQVSVVLTVPPIMPHLVLGINQVTKRLEHQARAYRQTLTVTETITENDSSQSPPSRPISIVFVCRADVDPSLLISHLPTLIASCNSSRNALTDPASYPPIKLVTVPKGSESLLADAVGLRRLAVLALDVIVLFHSAAIQ